jgi:gas vesicle protein
MRFVTGLSIGLGIGAVIAALLTGASGGALRATFVAKKKDASNEAP